MARTARGDGQTVPWPRLGLIALLVVTVSTGPARAQVRGGPSRSTDRVVSPSVVASFISHTEYSVGRFTLLVLWRGSPGWSARGGGHSGGASGGGGGSSFGESRGSQYFSYGGLSFNLDFNWTAAIVKLLDREISLRETNLILVDHVDTPSGPTIIDRRWIDVPI